MNRHQRRAAAAEARYDAQRRREAILNAVKFLEACNDRPMAGATLTLPDGEVVQLLTEAASVALAHGRLH